ncbi:hypothetical protein SAMN05421504_107177 [Amycolatopsis xylanica]|uniref:CHAP domain-containing protein n=1 Tax=Amycolatopsis xylanica TaxID=589385 RepID=A0A1H3N8I1_9PSEU|nr:hypothetical protein [Amycolatopsis xylanica]SDY85094.1 hypothetical protein SAMN05421504_107177 [Amycolatopsis xylanica]
MGSAVFTRRAMLGGATGAVAAVAAGSTRAVADPTYPADPYPSKIPHLIEAEQLVDYLTLAPAANNVYKLADEANTVTWGTPGQPPTWVNKSQCASFQTHVLRHTYPDWATDAFFGTYFGSQSPTARVYRDKLANTSIPHFEPVPNVAALRPGDLIAIDYVNDQAGNTGHIVMVREIKGVYVAPSSTLNFDGETQYAVEIVDCTSDPHGEFGIGNYAAFPDVRLVDAATARQGAGYGHMMFYASNATGRFTRYRWSVNSSSTRTYTVAQRPIVAARVS